MPPPRYLAADAGSVPDAESFAGALAALFPLAYARNFASKREADRDYVAPPLEAARLALAGKHHEIYLSDFRRTAPEKLRTILRQPGRVRV